MPTTFMDLRCANRYLPMVLSGEENELDEWEQYPCILEFDLEYPKELHDLHNDNPLAPERIQMNTVDNVIPNLWDKKKYDIHHNIHTNLQQYLSLGLKINEIHKGIKFEESPWLKKYIKLNIDLRTKATNEFEKDIFKTE